MNREELEAIARDAQDRYAGADAWKGLIARLCVALLPVETPAAEPEPQVDAVASEIEALEARLAQLKQGA